MLCIANANGWGMSDPRFRPSGFRRMPSLFASNGGGTSSCDNVNNACVGFVVAGVILSCSRHEPLVPLSTDDECGC